MSEKDSPVLTCDRRPEPAPALVPHLDQDDKDDHDAVMRLRPAALGDLELLRRWDAAPHIIAAKGTDDWGWETDLVRRPPWREQLIVEAEGVAIGFVQIIDPAREDSHYWGDCPEGLRAIDIWIGEDAHLGRGLGSQTMRLAIERCFADSSVNALVVDPLVSNDRARRFYERLGFCAVERRRFGSDDCVVFRLDRRAWRRIEGDTRVIVTPRLLLRSWRDEDLAPFAALNADPQVARHLPSTLRRSESDSLAARIRTGFERHGFGLFAAERLDDTDYPFIGFIGLSVPAFHAHFTPCVEIGWRLAREHWGAGLATEGAQAVARYAFGGLRLGEIVSFTVPENHASRRVMEKIGMVHDPADDFDHPELSIGHHLRRHVLYRLTRAASVRRPSFD